MSEQTSVEAKETAEKIVCLFGVGHVNDIAHYIQNAIDSAGKINEKTKHQAEAWCQIVAEMIVDHGLEPTEPGKVMLEQVQHFLRRKLQDTKRLDWIFNHVYWLISYMQEIDSEVGWIGKSGRTFNRARIDAEMNKS